MTPERYRQIDRIFQAALLLNPDQRADYLDAACSGDERLRQEVESLITSDQDGLSFIEEPAFEMAARVLASDEPTLTAGDCIDRYDVVSLLGSGGMGEVYLAHDKRLDRKIALKLLPSHFTRNEERLHRFQQEARAASALNHPNIITIHEIGQVENRNFIATEFVDGETLRQRMKRGPLNLNESLDIAVQVCSALSAAHHAGIVHRDIKPENIMLRRDGYVKVLDFGLAKISEQDHPTSDLGRLLKSETNSQPGLVLGTPHYMSPEQARGQNVDRRTDIFSLGAVIYEMLTGRKPFDGETSSHVVVEILEKDPPPISEQQPGIPAQLEDVVRKALQKDRKARYQTAEELIEDLRSAGHGLNTYESKHNGKSFPSRKRSISKKAPTVTRNVGTREETWRGHVSDEVGDHWRAIILAILSVILLAGAASYFLAFQSGEAINSVAVLPFAKMGADSNSAYLSDGIANSLTYRLSRLSGLTVISNTAASRYMARNSQDSGLDLQKLGDALKVQAVVVGKVTQQGSQLQVSVELVDVRNSNRLWGEQYDRNTTEILDLQQEIVKGVSESLRPKMTRKDEDQLSKRYTDSTEAYQLYLRGRYSWNKRTEADLRKAIDFFDKAIGIDPRYALAYAGLADSYQILSFHGGLAPKDYSPLARAAAERALAIDDSLAEAHTSLAYEKFYYEWDWEGAEREFKRAIELDPNYATAHQWYGEFLGHLGRTDESLVERQKALRLDPLSPIITSELGFSYFEARKYDRAMEEYRKAAELFPDFGPAHDFLAGAYEQSGLYDQAIAECQKAITLANDDLGLVLLARLYARSGRRVDAQRLLAEMTQSTKHRYPPTHIAMVYAALGDKDKAFEWLERAYEQRHWGLTSLKVYPVFDTLRSDPRFTDLLKRMNFPLV